MNARGLINQNVLTLAVALVMGGLVGCQPGDRQSAARIEPATTATPNAQPQVVPAAVAPAPVVPPPAPVAVAQAAPPKKGVSREQCRKSFTATCSQRCRAKDHGRLDDTKKGRRIEADLCFAECTRAAAAGCP